MAYTKTQWVDNTTPIDKDNLNKIEQGIYDNSLVVDAVTNTLNPTDTETYKTAELTEGQITDVIGVNDIVIKGQTSQNGTPTPSAPVDVNVVSGSNVINTGNENLFPLILDVEGTQILQQRCNVIIQKDEFIFTATGTDMYFGNVATANSDYQKLQGKLIKIPANAQNIYLKVSNNAFSNNFICFFDENKVSLGYSNISTSKEIPSTAKYFTLRIGVSNSVSGTTYKTKVMVSTMDKAYVPYQGKELPLDLGKNLLPNNNISQIINGVTFEKNDNNSIKIIGKATAQTDYYLVGSSNEYVNLNILPGTYNLSGCIGGGNDTYMLYMAKKDSGGTITYHINKYEAGENLTINKGDTFRVFVRVIGGITIDTTMYPQLEKGSLKTSYMPYKTPIELCKIGNYQDYFYKSGSKWYLHKEIGKVTLNGNENWEQYSGNNNVFFAVINSSIMPLPKNESLNVFCDNYVSVLSTSSVTVFIDEASSLNYAIGVHVTSSVIRIKDTRYTSVVDLKTWLASNNVTLYYILATPTDTEITDTTLISQLEVIYNAPLYEQTNITQENNDLPMVLDITACKDNINGIKAFIRK